MDRRGNSTGKMIVLCHYYSFSATTAFNTALGVNLFNFFFFLTMLLYHIPSFLFVQFHVFVSTFVHLECF